MDNVPNLAVLGGPAVDLFPGLSSLLLHLLTTLKELVRHVKICSLQKATLCLRIVTILISIILALRLQKVRKQDLVKLVIVVNVAIFRAMQVICTPTQDPEGIAL